MIRSIKIMMMSVFCGMSLLCLHTILIADEGPYHAEALAHELSIGSMSEANFNKLDDIEARVARTGYITDSELSWSIKLLEAPPLKNTNEARASLTAVVVFRLLEAKRFTNSQKILLNQAGVWLTSSRLWVNRSWGLAIFMRTGDRDALPIARGLENDPNQLVGPRAKLFIEKYGPTQPYGHSRKS